VSSAQDTKVPIRGFVSMGAYHFVGYGGDPVNTLDPLNAKPGIFGGLVVIASWKQLQPTPQSENWRWQRDRPGTRGGAGLQ
jgi:hypothetical protein